MSEIIEALRQDHRNMTQLLDLLERQLAIFEAGDRPDYEIVESTFEYCLNYPDLRHHPLEDLVFRKLQEKKLILDPAVSSLMEEHESLARMTSRAAAAVSNILREAEVPRDLFSKTLRDFLVFYRDHIAKEEDHFFPAAIATLGAQDWSEIGDAESRLDDPLFGPQGEDQFQSLRKKVLQWDRESLCA